MKFSVIIPTLNESQNILQCLSRIPQEAEAIEIIVSDGGSWDHTRQIAADCGAKALRSPPGRGAQLNHGAAASSGEILLFLHADTLLPEGAFELLEREFQNPDLQIGTFRLSFDNDHWLLRAYAWFTRFETIFTRFGDQCIVARRSFFQQVEGFPNWPLFEDLGFLQKARSCTRIGSFPASVVTSARRFNDGGIVRHQLLNIWLVILFILGTAPDRLYRIYTGFEPMVERQSNSR